MFRRQSTVAAVEGLLLCSMRYKGKCLSVLAAHEGSQSFFLLLVSEKGTSAVAKQCRLKKVCYFVSVLICGSTCRYPNCYILVQLPQSSAIPLSAEQQGASLGHHASCSCTEEAT